MILLGMLIFVVSLIFWIFLYFFLIEQFEKLINKFIDEVIVILGIIIWLTIYFGILLEILFKNKLLE